MANRDFEQILPENMLENAGMPDLPPNGGNLSFLHQNIDDSDSSKSEEILSDSMVWFGFYGFGGGKLKLVVGGRLSTLVDRGFPLCRWCWSRIRRRSWKGKQR